MTINKFIKMVDAVIASKVGLSSRDLPDVDFWNYFDEGMSEEEARDAARECAMDLLADEGFEELDME